ncbi:hypothetical protein [Kitasatospora sp. NPDC089509]|uniref:hypothetical protein n=1 Tax=Kitasatospora sp. NPDC089509 TaxID=3364079 RepID=UPI0037F76854
MIVSKRNSLRLAAVATLGVLSLGLAGTAVAATPTVSASAASAGQQAAAHATITAKPSVTSVRAWEDFHVTGTTTGLKAGSTVTLQQKQHGKWVSLPASVRTAHNGSYALRVKLGIKGLNELRIVSGATASPVFTVTVR